MLESTDDGSMVLPKWCAKASRDVPVTGQAVRWLRVHVRSYATAEAK